MRMTKAVSKRLDKLEEISLTRGSHSPDSQFCVMEAVAFVAGEDWSDHPKCACPVISAFLRSWNDTLPTDADRDRLLKPLILKLIGTRNKKLKEKRALMVADWFVRVHTPALLQLSGAVITNVAEMAGAAAWAETAASKPTLVQLQQSALELVHRMIEAR